MKQTTIRKILCIIATFALICIYCVFAVGSTSDTSSGGDQGTAAVGDGNSNEKDNSSKEEKDPTKLGDCNVEIVSSRLAKDYEKKPVIIIKYKYTNNNDSAKSFARLRRARRCMREYRAVALRLLSTADRPHADSDVSVTVTVPQFAPQVLSA